MSEPIAVFSVETAKLILEKLNIGGGFKSQDPINPRRLNKDSEFHDSVALVYRNDTAETIPPYACLRVIGSEFDKEMNNDVVLVDKPNGTDSSFVFNGMYDVKSGQFANCYTGNVRCRVQEAIAEGVWGPKSDWHVEPNGTPAIRLYGLSEDSEIAIGQTTEVGSSDVFVVELQHVGGDDGTALQQCSYTYDITIVGEDTILKAGDNIGLNPNKYRRMNLGAYTKATHGLACYLNGELSVFTSNETPIAGTC